MSVPNAKPAPKGGLTWEREKAVVVAAAVPVVVLVVVLETLFPDLPLSAPFAGTILAQGLLGLMFRGLYRPVEQPRLIRFLAATVLAAAALMVVAALAIQALGWGEHSLPEILASFGGTIGLLCLTQYRLFRVMIERHDGPPGKETAR